MIKNNKKIIIYDSPMCCASGVCGPNPNQTLMDFQNILEEVRKMGTIVERYIITQSPEKFKENPEIIKMVQEHQLNILPITAVDGKIVKSGSYPTLEEFKKFINEK